MTQPTRRTQPRTTCPTCGRHTHLSWREGVTVVGQHWPPGGAQPSPQHLGPVGCPCPGTATPVTEDQIFDARRERHRTGVLPVITLTPQQSTSQSLSQSGSQTSRAGGQA